jgi:hypothetical protein
MYVDLLGAVTVSGTPRVLLACVGMHISVRVLVRTGSVK